MAVSEKAIVGFKIGARARKLAGEGCVIEGFEMLFTAIEEARSSGETELLAQLEKELEKYELLVDNL